MISLYLCLCIQSYMGITCTCIANLVIMHTHPIQPPIKLGLLYIKHAHLSLSLSLSTSTCPRILFFTMLMVPLSLSHVEKRTHAGVCAGSINVMQIILIKHAHHQARCSVMLMRFSLSFKIKFRTDLFGILSSLLISQASNYILTFSLFSFL